MELLPPSQETLTRINAGNSINYVQHSPVLLFDIWKCEKKNAAMTMKKLLLLEVLVFLVLIVFWSWTRLPAAVRFSGALLVDLSGLLCNPHMVFLLCNAIVFALFLLRRQTEISRNSVIDGDICGGTQLTVSAAEIFAPLPQPEAAEDDSGAGEEETIIKTVCLESVVLKPQCNEVSAIALQRQSGSSVESGAIENLNDEEFRRKIERFIIKNHEQFKVEKDSTQKQQNMNTNSLQIISY
nr:uncharacterized protein LOC109149214 [Ipomoea trifida]